MLRFRVIKEPSSNHEAYKESVWRQAIEEELNSIEKNKTWEMVIRTPRCKPIAFKWVYKVKRNSQGGIVSYKARLVTKGYVQKYGINYEEVFSLVARMKTILVRLVLVTQGWQVYHIDVQSTFLNGELEDKVYMRQPDGYCQEGRRTSCDKTKESPL